MRENAPQPLALLPTVYGRREHRGEYTRGLITFSHRRFSRADAPIQVQMPLSWNEIRDRAIKFSRDWKDETREHAEAKSFWDAFFRVFGRERRTVATFEAPVKRLDKKSYGYIDLFWKGTLLVEHKSAGKDISRAETQAIDYIQALISSGRGHEAPRYIIVSDFSRIALHDLEEDMSLIFPLEDLYKHVHAFAFVSGYRTARLDPESPANIKAAEIMAALHDALEDGGYAGEDPDKLLTRILFCLFAEDTGIFEPNTFTSFIENRTTEDGSDVGPRLTQFFQALNTPPERRQRRLDEELASLPYVNGALFDATLSVAAFDSSMRAKLLDCAAFDWSKISPAVFGSIFQGIMKKAERRQLGAHYTSERDIMKVLRSLFVDALDEEVEAAKALQRGREQRLRLIHERLAQTKFLDPACGCGNFLILAYREWRRIEQDILVALHSNRLGQVTLTTDIAQLQRVSVEQFFGIEILAFPAEIARVGMWLMDHQMNVSLSQALGQYFVRLPLKGTTHITCENALRVSWSALLPAGDHVFVLGNPPFVGKHLMTEGQNIDAEHVWGSAKGAAGVLDYVACWYRLAAQYIQGTRARVALVSTSSITQGEQPGAMWPDLFDRWRIKIHFAFRTFAWASEARGRAHVHVVIIGFAAFDIEKKHIFSEPEQGSSAATVEVVKNISPYLVSGPDLALPSRSRPISTVPACQYGSKPTDGGHLIVEADELKELLRTAPELSSWVRPLLCAEQYLDGDERWCLWLVNAPPKILRLPAVEKRLRAVREFRQSSKKLATQAKAAEPGVFAEIRQPASAFLVVPLHSSEARRYIPFGYFSLEHIVHNSCSCIPNATPFHFGVLSSAMHMAWVRVVCGRLESRYRYSTRLVYNNFPWPKDVSDRQEMAVERAAADVLEARSMFVDTALSEMYAPLSMPASLVRAHSKLDQAVDKCYRNTKFNNDLERVTFLFGQYEALVLATDAATAPLLTRTSRGPKAGV